MSTSPFAHQLKFGAAEVRLHVGAKIELVPGVLPIEVVDQIKGALTFENPERERAKRERAWGWQHIPETFKLWEERESVLTLPRGFMAQLKSGLDAHGIKVFVSDDRVAAPLAPLDQPFWQGEARGYQRDAVDAMKTFQQGVYKAPPGSGKTATTLMLFRELWQETHVIVNTTNIARQWQERCKAMLGIDAGIVGDGEFEVKDITICLVQSLWSKRDELEAAGFFRRPGMVVWDECHHVPAHTFADIAGRYPAKYRFGVSATPERAPGSLNQVRAILGGIFHETDEQTLVDAGVLHKPEVQVVETGFSVPFWPTHDTFMMEPREGETFFEPYRTCGYAGTCTHDKQLKVHRNNYHDVMKKLVASGNRTMQVAEIAANHAQAGHAVLVLSKRLKHLDAMAAHVKDAYADTYAGKIFMFTGAESSEERMSIAAAAGAGKCIIFSTLADEALDIPRLDVVCLAWPTANTEIIKQQIGRVKRSHPDKKGAQVIDFVDDVNVLRRQFNERLKEVYGVQGLQVHGLASSTS